jgi:large conductance mechanosensitive channel
MATDIKAKAVEVRTKMVKGSFGGFMEFVRTQGVVGLAVGLAIGAQSTDLVKNIVASIITPLVDLIIGKGGLNGLSWTVRAGSHVSTFTFGILVDAMIRFLAVAFVIYFVVKGLKLDKLDKKKES